MVTPPPVGDRRLYLAESHCAARIHGDDTLFVFHLCVSACFQQHTHYLRVSVVLCGNYQRAHVVLILSVYVCTSIQLCRSYPGLLED